MEFGELLTNSVSSLWRVFCGVGIGTVAGFGLGFVRFWLPVSLQRNFLVRLLLDAPKYPPPIAWIPFVILYFGIGNLSAMIVVAIAAVPPVFTQVYDGLRRVSERLLLVADNMEIRGWARVRHILLPAILPEFFTGLRVAFGMGWMAIIAAEMVSGQEGLGYSIQLNRLNLSYSAMVTDLIAIGVVGFGLQFVLTQVENRILPWKAGTL